MFSQEDDFKSVLERGKRREGKMTVKGGGNQWQKHGFSVFLNTDNDKKIDKCQRCRWYKSEKCKGCRKHSKFVDRGFVLIDRRKY